MVVVLAIFLVLQPQVLPIQVAVEVVQDIAVQHGKQAVREALALLSSATQAHLLMLQA